MKFLNPTNDYAFKRIFGNEHKKHILMSFLNAVLGTAPDEQIIAVTLLPTDQAPHIQGAKKTILDVRCHDQKGHTYIVEMQVIPESFFDKRVLYYVSRAYAHQLDEGQLYDRLKPVIFLGILNFNFSADDHYLSTHLIQHIKTQEHLFKDFRFTFAELPKFNKKEQALETIVDQWLYFFKHASQLEAVPDVIHEQAIKEAFDIVNRAQWTREEIDYYDDRTLGVQIESNRIRYGYEKGVKEGEEKGRLLVLEGIQLALKLIAQNEPIETIAHLTGLPESTVLLLRDLRKVEV